MNDSDLDSDSTAVDRDAARWLARRGAGLSQLEAAEFDQWWRADPRRAAAVARLEAAEDRLRGLADFADDPEFRALVGPAEAGRSSWHWAQWIPWALAASLAGLLILSRSQRPDVGTAPLYATTENGYQRMMVAGSVVQLNARSALRVPATGPTAELVRGEAGFTVLPGDREFIVQAGPFAVRSSAGTFSLRLSGDEISLLVVSGRVELSGPAAEKRVLPASERLTASPRNWTRAVATRMEPAQMQDVLSWQAPRVVFSDTRLADAIEQFNLYNWEQFELRDAALGERRVNGVFRADLPEEFVRHLASEHRIVGERVRRPSSSDRSDFGGASIVLRAAP